MRARVNISKKFKGARKEADMLYSEIPILAANKLTRRILLGITNSCYDPLGLVSPITVQLKIELRSLYSKELNLSWDADIPYKMKLKWVSLIQLLNHTEGLNIKRCIQPPECVGNPELAIFCDGAPTAMCAAAYIRWKFNIDEFYTQLIAAKTRVTPLNRVTIPRIEMQSAVLGVRLGNSIINGAGLKFKDVTYISDSKCTLATLSKESTALKEYMGNRVSEIMASTSIYQWYHVRSAENIADLGTRKGASITDIDENSSWQLVDGQFPKI